MDTRQPPCLNRGTLLPIHSDDNSCLVLSTGKYPVELREKYETFLRCLPTAHACPPTREVSINVDGFTNPGAWVHPYGDSTSKKG
jgi:hypothetical protein